MVESWKSRPNAREVRDAKKGVKNTKFGPKNGGKLFGTIKMLEDLGPWTWAQCGGAKE